MADELVICRGLEERGINLTDEDVDNEIESNFNFFDGESPTPRPTATATVMPTPSLTPLPTEVITEVVPTATAIPTLEPTATLSVTATAQPTATPVSQEAFDTEYAEFIAQFTALGIEEAQYREVARFQLCRERLSDVLAEEEGLNEPVPHASIYQLTFETEAEANETLAQIEESDFLTVWNTIRSRPPEETTTADESEGDPAAETAETVSTATADELLWRTRETLEASLSEQVADAAFSLAVNEPSSVLPVTQADGTTEQYVIIMVSGREDRNLSESELDTRKQESLQAYVDQALAGELQIRDTWRNRVPSVPVLDSKFLAAPTATPVIPVQPTVVVPLDTAPAEEAPTAEATEAPADDGE
jgi:hypothetical protein